MSTMPDGQLRRSSCEDNLRAARARYQQALHDLRSGDEIDTALRRELEQTIARIEHKLAQMASRRTFLERATALEVD